MHRFDIRVELDQRFTPGDIELDLRTNRLHPLHEHGLSVVTTTGGAPVLALTLTASDLWTAILRAMALFDRSGYVAAGIVARPGQCGSLSEAPIL